MTHTLCIYHGGCTDGVAAAWAVWKARPNTRFYAGVYQQEPPWDQIDGANVLFVDFSYKQPVMREIVTRALSVEVLDHHKTARDDLQPLFDEGLVTGVFDMDRCGAMIAWDQFHDGPCPALLQAIDAQDRWLDSRDPELIMSLRSQPHRPANDEAASWRQLMRHWDYMMTPQGTLELMTDGAAIHRYYRQRVDETKPHASPMRIGGYVVPAVNAPYYLASDVAGELAQDSACGIGAVWWRNSDGGVTFSLRSRGDVDVGVLATEYGGGGHAGAAGFKASGLEWVIEHSA